ncbi:MAG TPA: hypothetical protein VIJ25_19460 [Methylococcales bacterium]
MNRQSQWLFEAPFMLERERHTRLEKEIEKNGHTRQAWSECKREGTRQRSCDIIFKVKFQSSFQDFRREVERALERWMTATNARRLVEKLEGKLKQWHQEISNLKYPDNACMKLWGKITYRGPGNDNTWRVVDVSLEAYELLSKSERWC